MRFEEYERSDLACENFGSRSVHTDGAHFTERCVGRFRIGRWRICTESAAWELKKPIGTYVTFECGKIECLSQTENEALCRLLAGELKGMAERLTQKETNGDFGVFVAGLGNAELTADAIGPKTVSRLTATRHLREFERRLFRAVGCASISAIAPGVLGQTGIETLELLRGAVRYVRPDVVIVVDALAARSCERLASTIQVSDVGIEPGSGVGNHRAAVDRSTLGVPVISIGVPTVVNSATLVYDALREAGIDRIDDSLHRVLKTGKSFFVSPKESDLICDRVSTLLAKAMGLAFGGELATYDA